MSGHGITGGILAGGRGLRMDGRDKGLVQVSGGSLVERTVARLRPQVQSVVISANRNLDRYAQCGFPVHADDSAGFLGPLAGIATLLAAVHTQFLLTVPCDTPDFPEDLALRLHQRLIESGADAVVTHDGEQRQFLFALYRCSLAQNAAAALAAGERAVWRWQEKLNMVECEFAGAQHAFTNFNSSADIASDAVD